MTPDRVHLDTALKDVRISDTVSDMELVRAGKSACRALQNLDARFWESLRSDGKTEEAAKLLKDNGNFILPVSAELLSSIGYGPLPNARELVRNAQEAFNVAHIEGPGQAANIRHARKLVGQLGAEICRLSSHLENRLERDGHLGNADVHADRWELHRILRESGGVFAALVMAAVGGFGTEAGKTVFQEYVHNNAAAMQVEDALREQGPQKDDPRVHPESRPESVTLSQLDALYMLGHHEAGRQADQILKNA